MLHVDPTRCAPSVPPTFLLAAANAALREKVADQRAAAKARRERNPQKPAFVERRKEPRILGFNGVWSEEQRLAEAHMAAQEARFTGLSPLSGWDDLS